MKHRAPRRRRPVAKVVATVVVAMLATAGVAAAYWQGAGAGVGSAPTATTLALTLSPATPAATLAPGGSADVMLTVANLNQYRVDLTSLALDPARGTGGFGVDSAHSACDVASLAFTAQTNGATGWTIPARDGLVNGTLPITLTDALSMDVGAASACQGAVFTVYLVAGA